MKVEDLSVMSYFLAKWRSSAILLERRVYPDDAESWAVTYGAHCLNSEGKFEYEPSPSNREDDFLDRCRWKSAAEALAFWEKWMEEHKDEVVKYLTY